MFAANTGKPGCLVSILLLVVLRRLARTLLSALPPPTGMECRAGLLAHPLIPQKAENPH